MRHLHYSISVNVMWLKPLVQVQMQLNIVGKQRSRGMEFGS